MGRVLELWVTNQILVEDLHWKIYANSSTPPTYTSGLTQLSDQGRVPIDAVEDAESYVLLRGQLLAATERRAGLLSKSVMHDLERRLLQRQQNSFPFETFLVGIVLLNCVERACWYFRALDNDTMAARVSVLSLFLPPIPVQCCCFAVPTNR